MDKVILVIKILVKILVTEQKVKFYAAICSICEKIERYLEINRK